MVLVQDIVKGFALDFAKTCDDAAGAMLWFATGQKMWAKTSVKHATYLSFVTVNEHRVLCSVQDDTERLDHGGRLHSHRAFVGGNGDDFLMDPIYFHEFDILWREGLGDESASMKVSDQS